MAINYAELSEEMRSVIVEAAMATGTNIADLNPMRIVNIMRERGIEVTTEIIHDLCVGKCLHCGDVGWVMIAISDDIARSRPCDLCGNPKKKSNPY